MHAQDSFAALHVGPRHDDAAVEAAGAQHRRIEHVGPVGRGDDDHALVRLEAVHLDQELVERLLALVVPAAQACAAMASDGVDLVDEDDAWRVLLALHEQVAHARRAHADEHLDEVRARDLEERHARLARDGAREQRLAGPRRADQQHALGDAAAEAREPLGVRRNSMISSSSSFASSMPATSANVTLWVFSVSSLARLFPNDIALPPPICIWRMKKIQSPTRIRSGNHCTSITIHQGSPSAGLAAILMPLSRSVFTRSGSVGA